LRFAWNARCWNPRAFIEFLLDVEIITNIKTAPALRSVTADDEAAIMKSTFWPSTAD
jgi:hypothetical protein